MKAIIIAAGLGSRLRPYTKSLPKSLVKIGSKTILEWQLKVFNALKINNINLIIGYKKEKFKDKKLNFFLNKNFRNNNILESLFCAKKILKNDCIISYSDIIFETNIVKKLKSSKSDISILVDKNWKKIYKGRTKHPISQAENVYFNKKLDLKKVGKNLGEKESNGEFIGMLKLSKKGCGIFKRYYRIAKLNYKNKKFFNATSFKKAYLTDFFSYLLENNVKIKCVVIKNNWMEIDTVQDFKRAQNLFKTK
jgi:choline kinase